MPQSLDNRRLASRAAVISAGAIPLGVGFVVLLGWWLDSPALKAFLPGMVTMKPNTALGVVLAGSGLLLASFRLRKPFLRTASSACAAFVSLLGLATLAEYLGDLDFGIDELLFREHPLSPGTSHPGRMSPLTACGLALIGAALLLHRRRPWVSQILAVAAAWGGILAFVGYAYGEPRLYGAAAYTEMALHTAISLVLLSFGVLLANPVSGPAAILLGPGSGGLVARRLLPATLILLLLLGAAVLAGHSRGWYDAGFGFSLLALASAIVFSVLIWLNAAWLNRAEQARIEAEQSVRAQRNWLEITLASVGDAVVATDVEGRVTFLNRVAAELSGWSLEEALGRPLVEVLRISDENTGKPLESPVTRALREGVAVGLDNHTTLIARDGSEIPISDSAAPIRDNNRQVQGVVMVFRDMREHRRAEAEVAKFKLISDHSVEAQALLDREGRYIYVNRAHSRMHGFDPREILGRNVTEIDVSVDLNRFQQAFDASQSGELPPFETVHRRKDGSTFPVEVAQTGIVLGGVPYAFAATRDISERKKAEEELRRSERTLRSFYDSAPMLMGIVELTDDDILHIYDNAATARFFGRTETEGQRASRLGAPREVVRVWTEHYLESQHTGRPVRFEYEHRMGETSLWLAATVSCIGPGTEGRMRYCYVAEDITERKLAEQRVRSEVALRHAIEAAVPDGIAAVDRHGRQVYVNRAFCEMVGWSREELIGAVPPFCYWPPEETDRIVAALEQTSKGEGSPDGLELRFQRRDGERFEVLVRVGAVDSPGLITGWLASVSDISTRKKTEKALRESEERLRFTLQAARVGSWDWNIERNEVQWSENLEEIHGRPRGSFGQTFRDVVDEVYPPDRPVLEAAVQKALREDGSFEVDYRIVRADGSLGWLHGQGQASFDESGRPVRMAGVCMDVTERRRAEEIPRLMAAAGEILAASLDMQTRMEALVDLLVPSVGDWCAIDLIDGDQPQLVAVVHTDPRKVELARELRRRYPLRMSAPQGVAQVIRTGHSQVLPEISPQQLLENAQNQEHFRILMDLGLKSALIVPLIARGRTFGAITLVSAESNRRYTERDLSIVEGVASRCALAIDNARLFGEAQRELAVRRQAQEALRQQTLTLATINRINMTLAAELDLDKLIQQVTDAGTELIGAEYGALFYNVLNNQVESYQLCTLSGAPQEQFKKLPMPRNTEIFAPTFRGEGVVLLDDVTKDPRYGNNAPHYGMPAEHPVVRSYLAVPVISRTGEVHGGLFFGHSRVNVFTQRDAELITAIAAQTAIAVDNARLYQAAHRELEERRQAEENLRLAREAAEAANRTKSEFLANMSHEIRTPMTAILGYADVLSSHLANPDDLQLVDTVRRNGHFLLEIINDILDLSRIEAGKLEIQRRSFRPDEVIADVQSLIGVRAQEKRLPLLVEFDGPLPETIESDPVRLRQILLNLLGNAIKFTESGSVRLCVRLLAEEEKLRFEVTDTGIGMSRAQMARLFQPFAQVDSSVTRRHGGSGLGLIISRRLVEMLGGEIDVASTEGRGSTFGLTVRTGSLAGVPLVEPRAEVSPPSASEPLPSLRLRCRVLVVDDRREVRYVAQHFIEEAGGEVAVAGHGLEALNKVAETRGTEKPFDVILMDMQMPVMDGYQATAELRAAGFQGSIIALTAHAMQGDRERCLSAGCNDYLDKPIRAHELIEMLARHTPQRERMAAAAAVPPPERSRRRRVLLVDDNEDACEAQQMLLAIRGFEVQTAFSGMEAVQAARKYAPDAVVLDIGLPDISGYEVMRQIRNLPELRETVFIALSGRGEAQDRMESKKAGFHHHIVKPTEIEELETLLQGGRSGQFSR